MHRHMVTRLVTLYAVRLDSSSFREGPTTPQSSKFDVIEKSMYDPLKSMSYWS